MYLIAIKLRITLKLYYVIITLSEIVKGTRIIKKSFDIDCYLPKYVGCKVPSLIPCTNEEFNDSILDFLVSCHNHSLNLVSVKYTTGHNKIT